MAAANKNSGSKSSGSTSKAQIIKTVSQEAGLSQKAVQTVINSLYASIIKSLKGGKNVQFIGFGTYKVKKRSARTVRNPATGKEMKIGEKMVPSFTPGKAFKEAVSGAKKK